ncbi:MAG: phosphoribosylaminoimidazolesuccinocarboxamide synthase [Oligoflexia bacterium]|nr:phosphoribosylaminoimidazolesuccinocarboxamide synthase [Oligoflexia bacterium]
MEKHKMIYEGKAKRLYETASPGALIQEFKDSLTAFNAQKKGSFEGKGKINHQITKLIFKYLSDSHIANHFLSSIDDRHMLIEKLQMSPLEVVVRNRVAGSLAKRLGLEEGMRLGAPIVEFYYKDDALGDPIVTEDHALLLGVATRSDLDELKSKALDINLLLQKLFSEIGIELVDFKLEFGRNAFGHIVLADEISPDSCRLWDQKTQEKLDKDRFRRDLGKVEESYKIVCDKLLKKLGAKA